MADSPQSAFRIKQFKINRDQRWSLLAVIIIVASLVFTIYWSFHRVQYINYSNKARTALSKNRMILENKIGNIDNLREAHNEFKGLPYVLDDDHQPAGVDNSVILARALPAFYSKLEFSGAFDDFLLDRGYNAEISLPSVVDANNNLSSRDKKPELLGEPSDQLRNFLDQVAIISFSINVSELPFECSGTDEDEPCLEHFFRDLDRFIMPIRVLSLSLQFDDFASDQPVSSERIVTLSLEVETYFLPQQNVITTDQTTVTEEEKIENNEEENNEGNKRIEGFLTMSMRKNIVILIGVGLLVTLISWGVSAFLITEDIETITYKTIQIDIPDDFPPLDPRFFNEDSIDTFTEITINPE